MQSSTVQYSLVQWPKMDNILSILETQKKQIAELSTQIDNLRQRLQGKINVTENYANCAMMSTKINLFHPFSSVWFWHSEHVNTVEICLDFVPSKPVLCTDSSLRREFIVDVFNLRRRNEEKPEGIHTENRQVYTPLQTY